MPPELSELLDTVRHPKDRQDILDCIQREYRARDLQNESQITACWWPDGVDEHGAVITRVPECRAGQYGTPNAFQYDQPQHH